MHERVENYAIPTLQYGSEHRIMATSKEKHKILFVDDESRILTALKSIFRRQYDVYTATGGKEALDILSSTNIDVIVSDQRMPNMLGNELLEKVHRLYPQTMRLLLTGFMDKEAIIQTINKGEIYRFINKPWRNEELREIISEAAHSSKLAIEQHAVPEKVRARQNQPQFDRTFFSGKYDLLMMEENQEVRNKIRRFCKVREIKIYGTQNIHQAVRILNAQPRIGVIIIGLESTETVGIIGVLKQRHPDLVSIALTDETDAEVAVNLINSGQVFRYLCKPLETESFEKSLSQAFYRHNFLKTNIDAQKRFKVKFNHQEISLKLRNLLFNWSAQKTG